MPLTWFSIYHTLHFRHKPIHVYTKFLLALMAICSALEILPCEGAPGPIPVVVGGNSTIPMCAIQTVCAVYILEHMGNM